MTTAFQFKRAKRETEDKAEQAAASPWAEGLARAGLVAKGVLYGLVGVLAILVAARGRGRLEDRQGVLQVIADESFGKIIVGLIAVGLLGYAVWRFLEALLGHTLENREDEGVFKRIGFLGRGLLYAGLFVTAVLLIVGSGSAGGGGQEEDRATAWALEMPLGRWIVGAIGLGILGAGGFNAYRALSRQFEERLKTGQMSAVERRWATRVGVVGHAARAVVFTLVGIFLIRAAAQYDPKEAIGLDGALAKVVHQEYGPFLLGLVAFGLIAYGTYSLIEARYREV